MTLGHLFTKLSNGVLALFGMHPAEPASPAQSAMMEVRQLMSQLTDLVTRLSDALTRISADESGKDAALAQANTDKASLQQQLDDAEAQLVSLLTRVVSQAETISPPPPPPPAA